MKNRSHRYDINRPRSRHGHEYSKSNTADVKKCLSMEILFLSSNTSAKFEAQFMKKLSNTEVELKHNAAYKIKRVFLKIAYRQ